MFDEIAENKRKPTRIIVSDKYFFPRFIISPCVLGL
jgi:hypothetical protein